MRLIPSVFLALCALLSCNAQAQEAGQPPHLAKEPAGYADASSCLGCHAEQAKDWKDSDHDWAMREPSKDSVLGDFSGSTFDEAGVTARFFRKGDTFFVNTEGADGKPADFEILYTFGHYPLQQYLVAFPGGRLQALTIAWDSRPKAAGGQRWFSLYPGQRFAPNDPLHWTGRYQNWNAMCADCHSTNLLKQYNDKQDSFATTWHEQNVGCQACHGPSQAHVDWAKQAQPGKTYASPKEIGLAVDFKALGSKGLVEQCAYCHSRRQSLGVGQQHGHAQLDATLPATLRPDLYHADGQIDGEVYVYGSFSQSKMFAAGVTCTDCHNPHSTQVKIEGNGLCQQCHNPNPPQRFPSLQAKNYDTPEHHHHQAGTPGAQCVNCHMPAKTYMVVDPRRDHSLRIPRPDLADKAGSPDACTTCHQDKQPAWAAKAIEGWFGQPQRPPHYGEAFHQVRQGTGDSLALLTGVIQDLGKPAIVRATAAEQLANLGAPALPTLRKAIPDESPLVRAYAISGFAGEPPVERVKQLLPLLDDPDLAVRDEAVRALTGIPSLALPEERRAGFKAQKADYERRLRSNADLPGNRLNLAVFLERDGRQMEALDEYRQALKFDPYFSPARINLVTLANGMLRQDEAEQVLREGVALPNMPVGDHGNLVYMLSLLLVERGQADEGLKWMDIAAQELPQNSRIRYNQGLLLLQLQRHAEAQAALEAGLEQSPDDADLLYALIYLHGTSGQREQAQRYTRRLEKAAPNDPRLVQLKGQ
ncbi:tetratricopeptide repeat protein [Metapseudomonas resinovorans]|uniref:tetratricopeptide repeat protein n=1 Tax=Metapseudomonas resinovorans TaxID=53412 RepID=UPI001FDF263D|nr:tetratricopeptide repeat protein [Pseudomonas resinovorans]